MKQYQYSDQNSNMLNCCAYEPQKCLTWCSVALKYLTQCKKSSQENVPLCLAIPVYLINEHSNLILLFNHYLVSIWHPDCLVVALFVCLSLVMCMCI